MGWPHYILIALCTAYIASLVIRGVANDDLERVLTRVLLVFVLLTWGGFWSPDCRADAPRAAVQYRAQLTRIAHAEWGLNAPVAVFAAQIHQESAWNAQAVSKVGAQGMAQFMPATARWWCQAQKQTDCTPNNPTWAMRAMVGYDRWLFERVRGATEYDRMWAALRSYNGGLGHWQAEAAKALPETDRESIDVACGKAKRSKTFCPENLGYPRRIMVMLQPLYATWGPTL